MKRAAPLLLASLAACSAPTTRSAASARLGPAETGAEASAAIAAATRCAKAPSGPGTNDGYLLAFDQAIAHRDPSDAARWLVEIPLGTYIGRLPPPGPGEPLLIAVTPSKDSLCTTIPSAPRAP